MKGLTGLIQWINSALNGRIPGLFGMPLRKTTGFVESLLRLAGLDWKVPDFSTLCRRQKSLNVAIPYRVLSQSSIFLEVGLFLDAVMLRG